MATTMTETRAVAEPEMEIEPEFPPHLMTVDRYEKMVEAGVYGPRDPVFLWDGRLVEKMPKGDLHSFASLSLLYLLIRMIPAHWHVAHEIPLKIGLVCMPEPDLMVVRGQLRDFLGRARTSGDVGFVVEIADASVTQDSVTKLRAYAADRVPIYWVANLPNRRIIVHSDPSGPAEIPGYRAVREYGPGDEIPVVLDGIEVGRVAVSEILPAGDDGR